MLEILKRGFDEFQIEYNQEIGEKFIIYSKLLMEWNKKINLTAITDPKEIALKHFVDSLSIYNDIAAQPDFIDIGSGAGFPGIPLCIAGYEGKTLLVDSLNKRVNFINLVIDELALPNCNGVHMRAEDAGRGKIRESFSSTAARAVAPLPALLEYCLPVIKKGGIFIAMKGPGVKEEIKNAKKAISILGGKINNIKQFKLPGTDMERTLVYVKKIKNTPNIYPRKAGTPSKRPL